jgi:hypothetical protein
MQLLVQNFQKIQIFLLRVEIKSKIFQLLISILLKKNCIVQLT